MTNSRIYSAALGLGLALIAISGCAQTTEPASDAGDSTSTSKATAQETCESLTDPLSDELNATEAYNSNQLDLVSYEAVLRQTELEIRSIPVEPETDIARAVASFIEFGNGLDAAGVPTVNGVDYSNNLSGIALACNAQGSDLVIRDNVGG